MEVERGSKKGCICSVQKGDSREIIIVKELSLKASGEGEWIVSVWLVHCTGLCGINSKCGG